MKCRRREIIIIICIVLLQILFVVYWANIKTNYHVDELYSMGYARNFAMESGRVQYITESPEFGFDKWIDCSALKKYMTVTDNEKFYTSSFSHALKEFVNGRNYFGFLNIAESIISTQGISSKAGLVLNVIFMILADIAFVTLLCKLHVDEIIRHTALAVFGFSGYMISMVEYIRFYMLIILLALIVFNLFYKVWDSDKWSRIILSELIAMILIFLAYRNSELTLPFFGSFIICFTLATALMRRKRQFISCIGILIIGLAYLLVKTDFIGVLFRPDDYLYLENVWVSSSLNISNASFSTIREYFTWLRCLFETYYFSSVSMVYVTMGAITLCVILSGFHKRATDSKIPRIDVKAVDPVTIVSLFCWIIIFAISHMVGHGKIFSAMMIFLIAVIGACEAYGIKPEFKKPVVTSDTAFVAIILGEALIYTVFEALCRHEEWRYYCYGFVSVAIISWYVIDRALKMPALNHSRKAVIIALCVLVAINSLIPFRTRNIENMYENERAFIETVRSNSDLNVILISEIEDGTISRHEAYDCVNIMPDDTKLMFVDVAEYEYDKEKYPKEFILWTYIERDVTGVISDVRHQGYLVEEIGSDHCSKAYVCKR